VNPFSALFGLRKTKSKKKSEKDKEKEELQKLKKKGVGKDAYSEALVRKLGEVKVSELCFDIFDIYKKAHDMPSHPTPEYEEIPTKY
jgi:hypothetical protein